MVPHSYKEVGVQSLLCNGIFTARTVVDRVHTFLLSDLGIIIVEVEFSSLYELDSSS